jgi:LPXTG-motif cell wall-anchored protein
MKNWLLTPPSLEDFVRLLRAWRFWVIGALLGGLLGAGIYFVFPPDYRARAVVIVDFNVEKAWPDDPDSQRFYYLDRESRKLVEVAKSDDTLQIVSAKLKMPIAVLRPKLELSQPQDGGWQFYATDPQPDAADKLAAAWAAAFVTQVRRGIQTEIALSVARKQLEADPNDKEIQDAIETLQAKSLGITPELQVSLAQSQELSATPKTGLGSYVLAGAGMLLVLVALWVLFVWKRNP